MRLTGNSTGLHPRNSGKPTRTRTKLPVVVSPNFNDVVGHIAMHALPQNVSEVEME
jgi:hypothetical protein